MRGGEESVIGVFYKQVQRKKEDARQGEADTEYYSVMRTFSLFHTSQIDGFDPAKLSLPEVPGGRAVRGRGPVGVDRSPKLHNNSYQT